MQVPYFVLLLAGVATAGLGGSLLGWIGASAVTFLERWEPARRAAVLMHLRTGRHGPPLARPS